MGSWTPYIEALLKADCNGTQTIQEAAIWGRLPGQESEWASSCGLKNITRQDIQLLAGDRTGFMANGPTIAGMKCRLLSDLMDDESTLSLNMKTKAEGDKPAYSLCVGKTHTAFVITMGPNELGPGVVCERAFKTIDHLRKCNL